MDVCSLLVFLIDPQIISSFALMTFFIIIIFFWLEVLFCLCLIISIILSDFWKALLVLLREVILNTFSPKVISKVSLENGNQFLQFYGKYLMLILFDITFEISTYKQMCCQASLLKIMWYATWNGKISFLKRCAKIFFFFVE